MLIGKKLAKLRKELGLTKTKLSKISSIDVKTIRLIETSKRTPMKETLVKIRVGIKKEFGLDISDVIGKIVWDLKDLGRVTLSIIEGSLLGDGSISKDGIYTQQAKDGKYLQWLAKLLTKRGVHCTVIPTKHKSGFSKSKDFWQLYSHTCPALADLRKKWYIRYRGKTLKIVPPDIKIIPVTLLHWYLGDGSFKRDFRSDQIVRPYVRLHSLGFTREDIKLLIDKLGETGLEFISVPKLSYKKKFGYDLYSEQDSVFTFFKIIGLFPIKGIEGCITRIVTTRGKVYKFKDKWPTKEDWLRILPQIDKIGLVIGERREILGMSQSALARVVGTVSHHICQIESGKKHPSSSLFKRLLLALQFDIKDVLGELAPLR